MWAIYKDGKLVGQPYSTPEQCAAEILVRGWSVVEQHGTWFIKGVEIRHIA